MLNDIFLFNLRFIVYRNPTIIVRIRLNNENKVLQYDINLL